MAIYNDKFKGFNSTPTSDDIMSLARAIIENTMRNLHVASIGVITEIKNNKVKAKLIPTNQGEDEKEIEVANIYGLEVEKNDIILILFLDKDFKNNLEQLNRNEQYLVKNNNNELHHENFAIILGDITNGGGTGKSYYTKAEVNDLLNNYITQ